MSSKSNSSQVFLLRVFSAKNMQDSKDCESEEEDEFKNFSVSSADSNDSILAGNTDFVY